MKSISAKQEALSKQDEVLLEAGKKMIIESVETSREYCKTMITVCISAIPIYFALLTFVNINITPESAPKEKLLLLISPLLFLLGTLIFISGYLPLSGKVALDDLIDLEKHRNRLVRKRLRSVYIGSALFALATVIAIFIFIFN